MRSALICLFFAVIVRKEVTRAEQHDDFRPTPIPLNTWTGENQVPAGTLQEFIKTDLPPTVAVIPAHYWEDALRHSVYLTMVRDKIDQLIEKGELISPNSKPDGEASKEVDDHDLWEKIKAAPFDRVKEEPLPPSDSIILARGRLLEEKDGYRFAEGDLSPQKCSKNNCTHNVKAYWSVKRTRQGETSPGKYHYELTFSVTSQSTKALRKKYENPVRTFTIRENAPAERPLPQSYHNQGTPIQHGRVQRAVWVHKNIGPSPNSQKRPENGLGLDRLFSSLFSDEDNYDDSSYRLKSNAYIPQAYQIPKHAKISRYSEREPYHQKKINTYPIKPPSFRYPRPPLQPPPLSYTPHSYFDVNYDSISHLPVDPDNRPVPSTSVKTTKPAVLPTPISKIELVKDSKMDEPLKTTLDVIDYTTKDPEITSTTYKVYTHKQTSMKVNYLPENIRHPIYNAPPGVFVTMDKKPFKPMPPLKSILSKPHKTVPLDFRPSPQILDTSYTNTDSTADSAFRPMTLNLTELFNMNKKGPKNQRKPVTGKNPPKKPNNIKATRLTTVSPDIITANSEEGNDEIRWAEILAAFTRTTPMESQKEKEIISENDFIIMTTAAPRTTTEQYKEEPTTTSTTTTSTTTTTTTAKPKRTRPPPKFKKPEKNKKHKRVTSTTTSTTTTARPTMIYPKNEITSDLTPQASSATTNGANSVRESEPIGAPTSTSSTTAIMTSTSTSASTIATTTQTLATTKNSITSTTTTTPSAKVKGEPVVVPTEIKSKNRFRQSMLMQKGTSLNHDKWSVSTTEKNRTTAVKPSSYNLRRKASKFQGYVPPSTPLSSTTSLSSENIQVKTPVSTEPTVKDTNTSKEYVVKDSIEMEMEQALKPNDVQGTKDSNEFIFPISPSSDNNSEKNSENPGQHSKTNQTVTSQITVENNKTKCKKKKQQILTTTEILKPYSEVDTTTITIRTSSIKATSSTISADRADLYNELLGGFTMDDITEQTEANMSTTIAPDEPKEIESVLPEEVFQIDDDIETLLNSLQQTHDKNSDDDDEYEEENDDEDSPLRYDEDGRDVHEDYYDETETGESQERPFNILELMAMK
ncbi:unnamed protein product [Arctia plantaginis]|uniref:Uncharacterized protein n=1 Tax=Arctia plantaginis TaxID=874455 RepID=A0A8S1A9V7_ARCPL|nr:unnamed protein product [Arctia plantaginis]CAB3253768.1 unnamed protein product [Arctia plantaginis]